MSCISVLPLEVITMIIANLSFLEINTCKLVCKQWNMIVSNCHFWQLHIKRIVKTTTLADLVLSRSRKCLNNLVQLSYYLDKEDGSLIRNRNLGRGTDSWNQVLGPYELTSDGAIKTSNKRFLRLQHLRFDKLSIIPELISECHVCLNWSVWICNSQDHPFTFSARIVDRCNKIITTFTCKKYSSVCSWTYLKKSFRLSCDRDLSQLYYKEVGHCLSCRTPGFSGVQILDPRISLEISEIKR